MGAIKYVEGQEPKPGNWRIIGKGWNHKTIPGAISGRIGLKKKVGTELVNIFETVELKSDDAFIIRPNSRKREGTQDPDFILVLLDKTAEEVKEVPESAAEEQ
jgi:hypothetical protein